MAWHWHFNRFLLALVLIQISWRFETDIEASSRTRCALALTAAGIFSSCGLQGCANPNVRVNISQSEIDEDALAAKELSRQFEEKLSEKKYDRIIRIHFNEYDFGYQLGKTKSNYEVSNTRYYEGGKNILKDNQEEKWSVTIPAEFSPQDGEITPKSDPLVFLDLNFRHSGETNAMLSLDYLLRDPKETLAHSLLIVSGGSWGVSAIGDFASDLRRKYGKEIDVILTSDGVQWPTPLPVLWIGGLSDQTVKLNFYQRNSILAGSSLPGFWNMKREDGDAWHGSAANRASFWASHFSNFIDLTNEGPKLNRYRDWELEVKAELDFLKAHPDQLQAYSESKNHKKAIAGMILSSGEEALYQAIRHSDSRVRFAAYERIGGSFERIRQAALEKMMSGQNAATSKYEPILIYLSASKDSRTRYSAIEWKFLTGLISECLKDSTPFSYWIIDNRLGRMSNDDLAEIISRDPLVAIKKLNEMTKTDPQIIGRWEFTIVDFLKLATKNILNESPAVQAEYKEEFIHLAETWSGEINWNDSYARVALDKTIQNLQLDQYPRFIVIPEPPKAKTVSR